jgi:dihydroorotase
MIGENPRNRRQALAMTLSAAALAGLSPRSAFAQSFDLVIKGGRVIDPASGVNMIADVGIADGRIAAIGPNLSPGSTRPINAAGKLVVPGLVDIHTHMSQAAEPVGVDLALAQGCTAWIDAGSSGADNIDKAIAVAKAAPQKAAVLINIGRRGMGGGTGDTHDIGVADVEVCRAAIAAHRDFIVGIKARLNRGNAADHDVETLRRAEEAAAPFGIPVMVHIGDTFSPLGKLLDMLKPGDIVTHILAPPPHDAFNDSPTGPLIPEVAAAHRRGVILDIGHGEDGHWSWDAALRAMRLGFVPDTTSTDWTKRGHDDETLSMPNMMSNLLAIGVPLEQVVAMATTNPAKCFPIFKDRGTLKVGAPADVTVLELRQGNYTLWDSLPTKTARASTQKLFAVGTVAGGKVMW